MSYSKHNNIFKANLISLFFIITFGMLTAPLGVLASTLPMQKTAEAHLKIPKIGIDAVIKDMGVTPTGAMAVPNNNIDVGWFSFGAHIGETGSAVIGAHNRLNSKPGVFARLNELKKDDIVSVVDINGNNLSFIVRDIHTYDALDTNTGIFESKDGIHLNLITCTGPLDPKTKSHTKRLVIFTDLIQDHK